MFRGFRGLLSHLRNMKYISQHPPPPSMLHFFEFFLTQDNASPFFFATCEYFQYWLACRPGGSMANGIMTGRVTVAFFFFFTRNQPSTSFSRFKSLSCCIIPVYDTGYAFIHTGALTHTPSLWKQNPASAKWVIHCSHFISANVLCLHECVSGRHAHVWLYIKGKTPILEHECLRWNRTWASRTIQCFQGVASVSDTVRPESKSVSLSLIPVKSQEEGALALK